MIQVPRFILPFAASLVAGSSLFVTAIPGTLASGLEPSSTAPSSYSADYLASTPAPPAPGPLGTPGGTQAFADQIEEVRNLYVIGSPGGTRGGESACTISPFSDPLETANGPVLLWSDRPLILWQGNVERVVVETFERQANGERQKLSDQPVPSGEQKLQYEGEPLQPGQLYVLRLTVGGTTQEHLFETLPSDRQATIAAALAEGEAAQRSQGASEEQVALWRSQFFASEGLYYDGLQSLFAIDNPSPEIRAMQEEIVTDYCENSPES
ncbi:MAG: hypothetical protein VKK04_22515 [Synechococcales bacterium]|nr:hypothetical protein [Synechococcales bacterium]